MEDGKTNSGYFFALEKRNGKRKSLQTLNINGIHCTDSKEISNFVSSFYSNLYTSKFNDLLCETYISKLKEVVPAVEEDLQILCDSKVTINEIKTALFSMKKEKSPGIDGLSVEFYINFWEIIQKPLFCMYEECISQKEMSTTMKQGIMSLIPKPDKDILLIDNWRPITLLTIDYKIVSLAFANRLKTGLDNIVAETQSGFMKGRHISNNIRLVLDLLDYADQVHSKAFILFLDFYKAFDTIDHGFLIECLKLFGYWTTFVEIIDMFYKEINSSVILNFNTSQRFDIKRGVRQVRHFYLI